MKKLEDFIYPAQKPTQLFHYTTQDGLLGIIEKGVLWTTQIQFLNDRTEFVDSLNNICSSISKKIKSIPEDNRFVSEMQIEELNGRKNLNVFVGSFTTNQDILSQWRGYTVHGGGFSIEFDVEQLVKIADLHSFKLGACIYEKLDQEEVIDNIAEYFVKDAACNAEAIDADMYTETSIGFACLIKNSAFQEEDEWRIFSGPKACTVMKFRKGRSSIIPYYELNASVDKKLPIKSITIGPTIDRKMARSALKMLLMKNGYKDVEIVESEIPYREP